MNDHTGANWRIWDLHVHTPASIVQHYGDPNDEIWNQYLSDLEHLPDNFKVIGINDYIFLDGYKRIISERKRGRLANIDLFLPVIELRLDKFGGTDSRLSRVNFHIIFSDEIEANVIEQQFLNALSRSYKLTPEYSQLRQEWKGVATRKAIEDLGAQIIASVPETERVHFGSPMVEGFNGLNFHLEDVIDVLDSSYFRDKHLTAVGKTEWWNIKWNDKSIADKKNIINSADLVFIASTNEADFEKARQSLITAKVNSRLLDCSDAHYYSSTSQKDRIGNCLTWIKGDPSLRGLQMAVIEPEERIFVGEVPPQVTSAKQYKTKYINSIKIDRVASGASTFLEQWFDSKISFNTGLVAIIGNKGSGKSALADIVSLLGNAQSQANFSFLNKNKFCKMPENKARFFKGTLTWKDGKSEGLRLDSDILPEKVERVRYVPQDYFEVICTQLPSSQESQFDKELKSVIFSHIADSDKLGENSLDDLLQHKISEIDNSLSRTITKIEGVNVEIASHEHRLTPEYAKTLQSKLSAKKSELSSFEKEKPSRVEKPPSGKSMGSPEFKKLESAKREIERDKIRAEERLAEIAESLDTIRQVSDKINSLKIEYESLIEELKDLLNGLQLSPRDLLVLQIKESPLRELEEKFTKEKRRLEKKLDTKNQSGFDAKIEKVDMKLSGLREKMDAPNKQYAEYRRKLKEWSTKKAELVGTRRKVGSFANLSHQIEELKMIPGKLSALYTKRNKLAKQAYGCLQRKRKVYQDLFSPVQKFVTEHPDIGNRIELRFDVSIVQSGFVNTFLGMINLNKPGAFSGSVEGKRAAKEILEKYNLDSEEGALSFADEIVKKLKGRESDSIKERNISDQLKKGKQLQDLYSYLYSFKYLTPKYVLRLGSKDLGQLSPGERGALLVIFYLLIDKDTKPLIIDQPENNLDNETIATLLVPAIKKAKQRRQIVIVTHNPIIAVVCNADQIIVASIDKTAGNKIEYESGAIENPIINKHIVDILEGALPAFDNRNFKYIRYIT